MGVMKYRKKPVVIEAVQYTGTWDSVGEIQNFAGHHVEWVGENFSYKGEPPMPTVKTWEGEMFAKEGDYIVKGIDGEFYPIDEDIFNKTYEKVEEK